MTWMIEENVHLACVDDSKLGKVDRVKSKKFS